MSETMRIDVDGQPEEEVLGFKNKHAGIMRKITHLMMEEFEGNPIKESHLVMAHLAGVFAASADNILNPGRAVPSDTVAMMLDAYRLSSKYLDSREPGEMEAQVFM